MFIGASAAPCVCFHRGGVAAVSRRAGAGRACRDGIVGDVRGLSGIFPGSRSTGLVLGSLSPGEGRRVAAKPSLRSGNASPG